MSPFESLPRDLLRIIVDSVLDDIPTPEDPVVGYNLPLDKTPWLLVRTTLRNLCLTSKTFCEYARKALYRHATVTDGHSMALFLDTLIKNPLLGPSARTFACLVGADATCTTDFPLRTTVAGFLDFSHYLPLKALADVVDSRYVIEEKRKPYRLFMDTLIALLWLMPNVDRTCLPLPVEGGFGQSRATAVFRSLGYGDRPAPPLQNLTYVQIWPHGLPPEDYLDLALYGPVFGALPKLERLELTGDDGDFEAFSDARSESQYAGPIRHLVLQQSSCTPCDVTDICNRLGQLCTLSVTTNAENATYSLYPELDLCYMNCGSGGPRSPSNCLNDGLPLIKDTLTSLHLQLDYNTNVGPLFGPAGKLTSLPTLSRLRMLSIGVLQLYTLSEIMTNDPHRSKLVDLLPASISEFRLHIDAKQQRVNNKTWCCVLLQILEKFAENVRVRLPHLATVILVFYDPSYRAYDSEFATLAADFAQQGVLLSYRESDL
ncbi:hypothetical protein JDV02_010700 [Purpureocillium takamizusanense]|uniref:Uncharacterized protein n=1 Tax=Purpureocillium takamizusanense TaxID=2060973 RepID=A0A9Q8QUH8_9HYPO|nr:uncharacterized protein JDV02_010700 [Purpureocillium takamizusanense]UNI24989.1 hypothetical protein JDV02_010700 [Purpureocillium takamizusanense]